MKFVFVSFVFLNIHHFIYAQHINARNLSKPSIDTSVFGKWPSVSAPILSNNGEYVIYTINNQPVGSNTLIIQSVNSSWKREFIDASESLFTENSKNALFKTKGDSLCILTLGRDDKEYIASVSNYKTNKGSGSVLAYWINAKEPYLILHNLLTGEKNKYSNVVDYLFDNNGMKLVIQVEVKNGNKSSRALQCITLKTGKIITIWEGLVANNFIFDGTGTRLAFISEYKDSGYAIWYYQVNMDKAIVLADDNSNSLENGFHIANSTLSFNENNNKVYLSLRRDTSKLADRGSQNASVDIWNYKDKYLQSEQLSPDFNRLKNLFKGTVDVRAKKIVRLENDQVSVDFAIRTNDYIIGYTTTYPDYYYNDKSKASYYLVSTNDGSKKPLIEHAHIKELAVSQDERFVVWFDRDSLSYFSYEMATGLRRNISKNVPFPIYDEEAAAIGRHVPFGLPYGMVSIRWLPGNNSVLIYDRYDIWQIDLKGLVPPVNFTNGYGRRHGVVFGIVDVNNDNRLTPMYWKGDLILAGYDAKEKSNGFWTLKVQAGVDPKECNMEPYKYYVPRIDKAYQIDIFPAIGFLPLKAKQSSCWLVQRMNAEESSNYFITKDFKIFQRISNVYPERTYNWLKAEIISWKMLDGRMSQGILYKPENFDSTKKYPLIFNYYAKRSDELFNEYLKPEYSRHNINIPSYVSRGYLVFIPDIYYSMGHNGQGVLNSVISAANFFCKFPWVDSTRLGLQGHSFGGWETNFLVTHSSLFAAACGAAGVTNLISSYGQLGNRSGSARQAFYETGSQGSSFGIGVTPWTRPDLYIENSPIFKVDKVTTPLLMMHCKDDNAVPFEQAVELFLGIKRSGKSVWLLQYDKEGHALINNNNAKDYSIRMEQFFDHYLKGKLPPRWMTEGIPATKKGIETGYELDPKGTCGRDCPICSNR